MILSSNFKYQNLKSQTNLQPEHANPNGFRFRHLDVEFMDDCPIRISNCKTKCGCPKWSHTHPRRERGDRAHASGGCRRSEPRSDSLWMPFIRLGWLRAPVGPWRRCGT